eukprot:6486873-Amphidinium_carterae.1
MQKWLDNERSVILPRSGIGNAKAAPQRLPLLSPSRWSAEVRKEIQINKLTRNKRVQQGSSDTCRRLLSPHQPGTSTDTALDRARAATIATRSLVSSVRRHVMKPRIVEEEENLPFYPKPLPLNSRSTV